MIKKLFKNIVDQRQQDRQDELYRDLIRHEAKIGGQLFGETPKGVKREFFCLDERTWIWHEEWKNTSGKIQVRTTRYDLRPDGVLKAQDGQTYKKASPEEIHNLNRAVQAYKKRVKQELYSYV